MRLVIWDAIVMGSPALSAARQWTLFEVIVHCLFANKALPMLTYSDVISIYGIEAE